MRKGLVGFLFVAVVSLIAIAGEILDVYFIDVGHGDAILVDYNGWEYLIDAGKGTTASREAIDLLLIMAIDDGQLEVCFLSHNHWDHYGGFRDVFAEEAIASSGSGEAPMWSLTMKVRSGKSSVSRLLRRLLPR